MTKLSTLFQQQATRSADQAPGQISGLRPERYRSPARRMHCRNIHKQCRRWHRCPGTNGAPTAARTLLVYLATIASDRAAKDARHATSQSDRKPCNRILNPVSRKQTATSEQSYSMAASVPQAQGPEGRTGRKSILSSIHGEEQHEFPKRRAVPKSHVPMPVCGRTEGMDQNRDKKKKSQCTHAKAHG